MALQNGFVKTLVDAIRDWALDTFAKKGECGSIDYQENFVIGNTIFLGSAEYDEDTDTISMGAEASYNEETETITING